MKKMIEVKNCGYLQQVLNSHLRRRSVMKKIEVTEEDIKTGIQFSCCNCPIALAVRRAIGLETGLVAIDICQDNEDVIVSDCEVHFGKMGRCFRIYRAVDLPDVAREFIRKFDSGLEVFPISFELELEDSP